MPPILSAAAGTIRCCRAAAVAIGTPSLSPAPATTPAITFLLSAARRDQTRHGSILATLSHNKGAWKKRKRVGRGASSGHGKTSGRGHKGTGQRGKVNPWFQGGQTPLIVSQGKKGEDNQLALEMAEVNLDRIQQWIDLGRLDPAMQITPKEMVETGLARIKDGVKLLGRNADKLRTPINIMVSRASATAIDAVERAGGRIVTRYYTRNAIQRLVAGESMSSETPLPLGAEHVAEELLKTRGPGGRRLYRLPDPTDRWHMEYYRDPAHRGYMSDRLQAGESPSLFFKVPKPLDDQRLRELMNKKLAKLKEKRAQVTFDQKLF